MISVRIRASVSSRQSPSERSCLLGREAGFAVAIFEDFEVVADLRELLALDLLLAFGFDVDFFSTEFDFGYFIYFRFLMKLSSARSDFKRSAGGIYSSRESAWPVPQPEACGSEG